MGDKKSLAVYDSDGEWKTPSKRIMTEEFDFIKLIDSVAKMTDDKVQFFIAHVTEDMAVKILSKLIASGRAQFICNKFHEFNRTIKLIIIVSDIGLDDGSKVKIAKSILPHLPLDLNLKQHPNEDATVASFCESQYDRVFNFLKSISKYDDEAAKMFVAPFYNQQFSWSTKYPLGQVVFHLADKGDDAILKIIPQLIFIKNDGELPYYSDSILALSKQGYYQELSAILPEISAQQPPYFSVIPFIENESCKNNDDFLRFQIEYYRYKNHSFFNSKEDLITVLRNKFIPIHDSECYSSILSNSQHLLKNLSSSESLEIIKKINNYEAASAIMEANRHLTMRPEFYKEWTSFPINNRVASICLGVNVDMKDDKNYKEWLKKVIVDDAASQDTTRRIIALYCESFCDYKTVFKIDKLRKVIDECQNPTTATQYAHELMLVKLYHSLGQRDRLYDLAKKTNSIKVVAYALSYLPLQEDKMSIIDNLLTAARQNSMVQFRCDAIVLLADQYHPDPRLPLLLTQSLADPEHEVAMTAAQQIVLKKHPVSQETLATMKRLWTADTNITRKVQLESALENLKVGTP